jgi:hypothetical protein
VKTGSLECGLRREIETGARTISGGARTISGGARIISRGSKIKLYEFCDPHPYMHRNR